MISTALLTHRITNIWTLVLIIAQDRKESQMIRIVNGYIIETTDSEEMQQEIPQQEPIEVQAEIEEQTENTKEVSMNEL